MQVVQRTQHAGGVEAGRRAAHPLARLRAEKPVELAAGAEGGDEVEGAGVLQCREASEQERVAVVVALPAADAAAAAAEGGAPGAALAATAGAGLGAPPPEGGAQEQGASVAATLAALPLACEAVVVRRTAVGQQHGPLDIAARLHVFVGCQGGLAHHLDYGRVCLRACELWEGVLREGVSRGESAAGVAHHLDYGRVCYGSCASPWRLVLVWFVSVVIVVGQRCVSGWAALC